MVTYYADCHGNSRLYKGDWSGGGSDNNSLTDWATTDEFILCIQVTEDGCNKATASQQFKLQFAEDAGGFSDITDSTAIAWGTGTSLTDGSSGTGKCSAAPGDCSGGSLEWTYENEGDNTAPDSSGYALSQDYYGELQWALDPANAAAGSVYTFQVVNVTDSNTALTNSIASSVTIHSDSSGPKISMNHYRRRRV